jgi:hypothetical protein
VAFRLAADLTVVAHLAFVAFLLAGGFVAWRRPAVLWLHVPAVAGSAALAISGLDCPLSAVEAWFRHRAGDSSYPDGFVAHYLVHPLLGAGITPALRVGLRLSVIALIAVAYVGLLMGRRPHREQRPPVRGSYAL